MSTLYRLFVAEVRRHLLHLWSYRFDTLGEMAMWLVAFPLMMVIFAGVAQGYDARRRLASWIGFLVWNLCLGVLSSTTREVAREAGEGTLECAILAPIPPLWLFSLRVAAAFAVQALQTAVLGVILTLFLGLPVTVSAPAPVLLALTMLGVYGVGLALGGLALVHKQVAGLIGIVSLLAVLATGALVPLNSLGNLFPVLKLLLPTAWGIDALRQAMLHGATWGSLWADRTFLGLTLQAAVLVGLGIMVFHRGFRRARREGSLGTY